MTSQCITLEDIAQLTNEEVKSVEQSARNYRPSDCQNFYNKVRSLESSLMAAYKLAAVLAKRTTKLEDVCDIWKTTGQICDSILVLMKSLKDSQPDCGTPQLYDLALDYKNAAIKRYQRNLQELQWEKKETAPGPFPAIS